MTLKCVAALILCLYTAGCSGLNCFVGVGSTTTSLNCSGDWTTMTTKLQNQLGTDWANLTTSLATSLNSLSGIFSTGSLTNIFSGRKRRQTSNTTVATTNTTSSSYYCVKKTFLGKSVKSCLPQSLLALGKMACATDATMTEVCTCNADNCNTGSQFGVPALLLLIIATIFLLYQ